MWFNSWNKKFGTIPASYKEAMTYEEQILWLCKTVEDLQLKTGNYNYDLLLNKPSINGVTLEGNKSLDNLAIQGKLIAGSGITINGNIISAIGGGGGGGGEASAVLLDSVVRILNTYSLSTNNSQTELETQNQKYNFNNYYEGVIFTPTTLEDNTFNCYYSPMNLIEAITVVGTNIQFILTDVNKKILYKSGTLTGTEENPIIINPYSLGFNELDYKVYINLNKADNSIKFSWSYPVDSILEEQKAQKERFNNATKNLINSSVAEVWLNDSLESGKAYNNSSAVVGELFTHLKTTETGKACIEITLEVGESVKISGNVSYVLCDLTSKCLKTESFNDNVFHEINPYNEGINQKTKIYINVENTTTLYDIWIYRFNQMAYEITSEADDYKYPSNKAVYDFVNSQIDNKSDVNAVKNLIQASTLESDITSSMIDGETYNFATVDVGDIFEPIHQELSGHACTNIDLALGEYVKITSDSLSVNPAFSYILCDADTLEVLSKGSSTDLQEVVINPYAVGRKNSRHYMFYLNIDNTSTSYIVYYNHYLEATDSISSSSTHRMYPTAKAVFDFASSTVNNQSITVLHNDLNLIDGTAPTLSAGFYTFESGKHCKINNVTNTLFDDSIFYYTPLSVETNTPAFYFICGKNINSQDFFNMRIFYSSNQYQNPSSINPQTSWNKISSIPLVTSISSGSTDSEFPSAKCVYHSIDTLNTNIQAQFTASSTDLTAGTSPLATGSYYFVYEV